MKETLQFIGSNAAIPLYLLLIAAYTWFEYRRTRDFDQERHQ